MSSVLFGNVLDVNELRQCWENLRLRKHENLRGSYGIKPTLDPGPHRGEECWCSKYLIRSLLVPLTTSCCKNMGQALQKYGLTSPDSVLWPIGWHPACGFLDSRTVSAQLLRYQQCCLTDPLGFLNVAFPVLQYKEA